MIKLLLYLLQYRFRDMGELLKNEKKSPLDCDQSLKGKVVLLSGATSGIGLETARLFASKGAELICLNRDLEKSRNLETELKEGYGCSIQSIIVDFGSLEQTKNCAQQIMKLDKPIDILIHNSGVFHTRKTYSQDGIEMVFQVNHLSSFYLNYLLKEKLMKEDRARIIYVNSEGHRFAISGVHLKDLDWKWHFYSGLGSYGAAKTAQLLSMMKWRDYFSGTGVTINAMHPGNVKSNIGQNNGRLYRLIKKKMILSSAKEPELSAQALYYLAASEDLKNTSGQFFNLTSPERPAPHARDGAMIQKIWDKSLELCGL